MHLKITHIFMFEFLFFFKYCLPIFKGLRSCTEKEKKKRKRVLEQRGSEFTRINLFFSFTDQTAGRV